MAGRLAVIALQCAFAAQLLVLVLSNERPVKCPCQKESWCDVVQTKRERELFIFSTVAQASHWKYYDWENATTIAVYGKWSSELMCFAHSKGVRVVIPGVFPVANLTHPEQWLAWMEGISDKVASLYADGINFDIEQPVAAGSVQQKLLTQLVEETAVRVRKLRPGAQVTFDVAWSPDCIDGRCFDFPALASVSDFLVIMAYDERSQVRGKKCLAGPNSARDKTIGAVNKYLDLGIPASSLVLALPWYGYDYTCIKWSGDECSIKHHLQVGVNCSDAVGHQLPLLNIVREYIPLAEKGVRFDNASQSMFFNYVSKADQQMHQIWFDNPATLSLKYNDPVTLRLRGKSMFTADCVYYGVDEKQMELTRATWRSLY